MSRAHDHWSQHIEISSRKETIIEVTEAWLCRVMAQGFNGDEPAIPGDAEAAMKMAREHRVDVILADLMLGASDRSIPDGFGRASLEDAVRLAAAREISSARDVSLFFDAAHRISLALLVLKGTALAYTHYPRSFLRPRSDVDLYVRPADLDRAEALLTSFGYERAHEADAQLWTGQRHYARATASGTTHVDLHWRAVNPLAFADVLKFDDVWPRSVKVPALGPSVRTLSPPDALLLACLHRVAHHQDRINLLWLWDIHLLASSLSEEEWHVVLRTSESSRTRSVLTRGLMLASDRFGTVIPEALRSATGRATGAPGDAFLRRGMRPVDVAWADLAALTTWRRKLALVREHVCPPISYMRTKYARCPPILLPLAYVHRIVRGAPRWFIR